jgi:tetratricopeptide (TPR) repeat protein
MWPFSRKKPDPLDPVDLRNCLIDAAASGSPKKLRSECQKYKDQVAQHLDFVTRMPDDLPKNDGTVDQHIQRLIAVAQCLANECGAPELWNKLSGVSHDNPFVQWNQWFGELQERMQRLEYDALISEAKTFIEKAKTLRGSAARQQEAILSGRLGELLFHSGRVDESVAAFRSALALCAEGNDVEGQIAYLNNLLEADCYLGDEAQSVATAEELLDVKRQNGLPVGEVEKRLKRLRDGEPLCRVTCVRNGNELELDEITNVGQGSYRFQFRRNRLSLLKATTLTTKGNELASAGNYSDAMEKYHEASEVDPYDPDPVYQSGMCLLELGAYGKAREAFEEVERLAPGWFRCRSDRWLAEGLESGTISDEEFRLLRVLDDGGLPPAQATSLVKQAVERFPEFAPLYLFLGNSSRDERDAIAAYRKGLELVDEPDLESRLLCALAGRLSAEQPERKQLVERAVSLKGSRVARATAKLMGLQ